MGDYILKTDNTVEVLMQKNEAVTKALKAISLEAEKYAQLDCPVDTGRLKGSITAESDGNSAQVGTNVEYAPYVELGHRAGDTLVLPRPFINPAIENHIMEYQEIIKRALEHG